MGEENIKKLAVKTSIPMIISMISMAIYNLVDTIFISWINKETLNAVSLCFPIQILISAIGLGAGIGANSLIAKTLGSGKKNKTKQIMFNSIFMAIISYLLIIIVLNKSVLTNIFEYFTTNQNVINYGMEYLTIIVWFSIFNILQNTFNKFLEAYGKAKYSMIAQFIGIVVNTILDPILIFGISGHLKLGIMGGAIATILGRLCGLIASIIFIFKLKDIDIIKKEDCKLSKNIIFDIYKVGLPTMLFESIAPIVNIILNRILIEYSDDAVSFFGIYYKTQSFLFMIISGMNYGMIPIIAYNLGAKKIERVKETFKLFMKASIITTILGTILFGLFPNLILGMFNTTNGTYELGMIALRILSIGFIFGGINFIISGYFQASGNGLGSLIIFLVRKAIIPFTVIIIFQKYFGLNSIWYSFTIAEIVASIVAIILYLNQKKKNEKLCKKN